MLALPYVGFLQHSNIFLFFLYFRFLWLPAKPWCWRDTIARTHPFFSLCGRYVGIWWVVLGVIIKLLIGFGGSVVSTVFKRTPHGTLHERNIIAKIINNYYISQLVRALWLVNLASRSLLYGPLNSKVFLVAMQNARDIINILLTSFSRFVL